MFLVSLIVDQSQPGIAAYIAERALRWRIKRYIMLHVYEGITLHSAIYTRRLADWPTFSFLLTANVTSKPNRQISV